MWVIRFHNGPLKGQSFQLQPGANTVGRSADCDIVIPNPNISKKHLNIDINRAEITITDLNSSNGTFVDGVKINSKTITEKQKITLHNMVVDIAQAQNMVSLPLNSQSPQPSTEPMAFQGNQALNYQSSIQHNGTQPVLQNSAEQRPSEAPSTPTGFIEILQNYIETVVMPGVYKIPENLDFKWTIGLFVGLFIVFVTSLSAIPLMRILTASIESESRQRALTIAKTESIINRGSIQSGMNSTLSLAFSSREVGVTESYIINSTDGSIMAPSSRAGEYPDVEFIHLARKQGLPEAIKQINHSNIVAVVGISVYNPSTGKNSNKAYSVVVYDMGNLAVDNNKTISLFVQTLFIALVVGSLLFFFLIKIIAHPIVMTNQQLDEALKNKSVDIESKYQFTELQSLISNINSALARLDSGAEVEQGFSEGQQDRTVEMQNLVQVVGFPCLILQASDLSIAAVNGNFEDVTNHSASDLLYGPTDNILDQALKLSIEDIVGQLQAQPNQMVNNQLDISGNPFDIAGYGVWGQTEVAYFVITLLPGGEA